MNGPGRQLKEPIPKSTNYLGAYDRYGNLVRAPPNWVREDAAKKNSPGNEQPAMKAEEVTKDADAEQAPSEGQEDIDKLDEASLEGDTQESDGKPSRKEPRDNLTLPPETAEDLRPFPSNQFFRSQPVLSEPLREAIYQRVKRDGATVSLASVEFGVSNERVGAVVRLKQMEKEWIAQVCYPQPSLPL
jgi:hypothetical protein